MKISNWRDLPFREILVVDTEYYPGAGLNNGGRGGDASTPLCLVALEMRSNRLVRLWQDELGRFPPYPLDDDVLIIAYVNSAEFGTHIALDWGQPACSIDAYIEFRHHTNDGRIKSGDREKGFYSIGGALRYFGEDGIDTAHKKDMRDRIMQGPPFTHQERADILDYCQSDVDALARLVPHIIPTIRSLPHAMFRAQFAWVTAQQERRGIPIDPVLGRLKEQWSDIQRELVLELDRQYGCYEFDADGKPHWRRHLFADYVRRNHMTSWPTHADGTLDEQDKTFREMEGLYPQVGRLRELRYSLSALRLNSLAVGNDWRNRTPLWPFGSKTGRNQPSNAKFIFGPAKWIRFLITPPPGRVLIHRDFMQQEPRVAAIKSGDQALLDACDPDIYLGIAKKLGFAPPEATPETHKAVRKMFKPVGLGIIYGLGPRTLAWRIGVTLSESAEILARLHAQFHVWEEYAQSVCDHAGLKLEISTSYDWRMQCPPGIKPRTVRNFPIQSTGAEILHVACILAERRGIEIIAPVHDALMAEADVDRAEEISAALDQVMRDAASIVLQGHELPTDVQIIRPGERYYDDRGEEMWNTVHRLLQKIEAKKTHGQSLDRRP
jgi:DNA polymerase I